MNSKIPLQNSLKILKIWILKMINGQSKPHLKLAKLKMMTAPTAINPTTVSISIQIEIKMKKTQFLVLIVLHSDRRAIPLKEKDIEELQKIPAASNHPLIQKFKNKDEAVLGEFFADVDTIILKHYQHLESPPRSPSPSASTSSTHTVSMKAISDLSLWNLFRPLNPS